MIKKIIYCRFCDQLTTEEIGILLQLVKNSNFNGNMIDALYHLTAKLQNEYNK